MDDELGVWKVSRLMWHHRVHQELGKARLFFWRLSFTRVQPTPSAGGD